MRMRIISATVVLSLGLVGITLALAQQAGEGPKGLVVPSRGSGQGGAGPDKVKLRTQVARLRAELELMELEHDADRVGLSEMLKEERRSDSDDERSVKAREGVVEVLTLAAKAGMYQEIKEKGGGEKQMQAEVEEGLKEDAKKRRAECDRKKSEFMERTTELNEKRLGLAEAEKRYHEAE